MGNRERPRHANSYPHVEHGPSDNQVKLQLEAIGAKLDKIINLLQPKETALLPATKDEDKVPVEKQKKAPAKPKKTSVKKIT